MISGDTVRSDNLIRHARGVDLLVHEGMSMELVELAEEKAKLVVPENNGKNLLDIRDYHTSPEDVAKLADEAGVRYLAFNHIVPMLPLPGMKEIFLGNARQYFDGLIHVGSDGDFSLYRQVRTTSEKTIDCKRNSECLKDCASLAEPCLLTLARWLLCCAIGIFHIRSFGVT